MIYKKNLFSLILLSVTGISYATKYEVPRESVFAPERLAITALMHSKKGFQIKQDDALQQVANHNVDKPLRAMSSEQLQAFVKGGYISVNQLGNGEFTLRANGRGLGGGPILGPIGYWAVKGLCYGTAIGGAIGTVAATGGLAGAVVGGLVGEAAAAASLTTAGTSIVSAVVASGEVVAATEAAAVTGGLISQMGIFGAATMVEAWATAVGAALTAVPFL
jgi:hypothetical protein